ncbi:N4-gp56 family major capsid protein [Chitinilyticum litopenaei]|uniref:N4-gp56 family major capsid protein n=1 Tax=Chitinilyticum litopenaei TaxID=1121276 RepID=UPI000400EC52|nr:N4-gp56 family major capsid protein [Chitinilyticum litopenaei]
MATTTQASLTNVQQAFIDANYLAHAEPIEVVAKLGMTRELPANRSNGTVKYKRPTPFAANTTPLAEGVAPTAKAMAYENVDVTIGQYGDVVELTDVVHDISDCPVLKDAGKLCGEQRAETIELVTLGVLRGGTNVAYTNGAARNAVNSVISATKLRGAVQFLMRMRAKRVTQFVKSSAAQQTVNIKPAFIGLGHTDSLADLEQLPNWKSCDQYQGQTELLPGEVGAWGDIRFCLTPLMPKWADGGGAKGTMVSTSGTSADVYPIIVFGDEGWGRTTVGKKAFEKLMVSPPDNISVANPLGQKGTVGWKQYFAAWIANQSWVLRIETAVTAL